MESRKSVDFAKLAGFFADNPAVISAWVFGSGREGTLLETSDLDIGILFDRNPSAAELFDLQAALFELTGIADLDLVVLNRANPILAFEAISGTPVFCRHREERAAFASLVAREYEDSMAMITAALA